MSICVFLKGTSAYDTLNIFQDYMYEAFGKFLSNRLEVVDFRENEDAAYDQLDNLLRTEDILFFFSFNGIFADAKLGKSQTSIFDYLGVPIISALVDNPIYISGRIMGNAKNTIFTVVDSDHLSYFDALGFKGKSYFLPLAGARSKSYDRLPTFEEREIDVLFCATYVNELLKLEKANEFADDDFKKSAIQGLAQYILQNEYINYKEAVNEFAIINKEYINEISQIFSDTRAFLAIDGYIRTYRRNKLVEKLINSGITVNVYGNNWEGSPYYDHPNFVYGGSVDYYQALDLMANSKIVLNSLPFFTDGPHDRIFSGMLNGAVVVTDNNRYLYRNFIEGENIVIYENNNLDTAVTKINEILSSKDLFNKITENALIVAEGNHTWEHRVLEVLRIFKEHLNEKNNDLSTSAS